MNYFLYFKIKHSTKNIKAVICGLPSLETLEEQHRTGQR